MLDYSCEQNKDKILGVAILLLYCSLLKQRLDYYLKQGKNMLGSCCPDTKINLNVILFSSELLFVGGITWQYTWQYNSRITVLAMYDVYIATSLSKY